MRRLPAYAPRVQGPARTAAVGEHGPARRDRRVPRRRDGAAAWCLRGLVLGVALGATACAPRSTPPDGAPDVPSPDVPWPDVPSPDVPSPDVPSPDVPSPDAPSPDAPSPDVPPLPWADGPCEGLDVGDDPFAAEVASFARQDDLVPPPPGALVVTGSSTIRRWRSLTRTLSRFDPLQRGVGGARLADLAAHLDVLVLRHAPRAVLVFAGTNDIADGRSPAQVVDAYRCLVERMHRAAPGVPVLYVGITPTPARWDAWPLAAEVNDAIERLAGTHPSLRYIDAPAMFLARGAPPPPSLFVADGLHLSAEGYALFEAAVLGGLEGVVSPSVRPLPRGPASGTRIRVDLGPSNPEDGAPAPAFDGFGIAWNAWHPLAGGAQAHAGEALRALRTTLGAPSEVALVLSGGFRANGRRNGGLAAPSPSRLGTMAVPEACTDFFYSGDPDDPAGLVFEGLDPAARYTLRLFASRSSPDEERRTGFTVHGAEAPRTASVRTTGADIGVGGYDGNDGEVTVLEGLAPDARGRLFIEVDRLAGAFCYVNLLELEAA